MLHHDVSYYLTLRHKDLDEKVNDNFIYQQFVTGNNTSTLKCYQVCRKGEARNDHKFNTGCVWSKRLYNLFTQKLGLEVQFKSSDYESDTKNDSTTNTNIKEDVNNGNAKVDDPDVKTVVLTGDVVPQGFAYESD